MGKGLPRRQFMQLGATAFVGLNTGALLSGCSDGSPHGSPPFGKMPLPQDAQGRWWLSNNFAPVLEEREAVNLKVVGELPRMLNGLYARNGSNGEDTQHWFLGHGMLHGIRLRDGQAQWYRNRYIHTALREAGVDQLTPTDPVSSFSNVAPIFHANKLLTMGEIGLPYQSSPEDLSTLGVFDFAGRLNGSMTAHPKIDPLTGGMLFFGYDFLPPYLTYYEVDAAGALVRSEPVTLPASVMMHDFAITENYVIFYDLPVVFDIDLAVAGSSFPFRWDAGHVPRMGVMPRAGGDADILWFEIDSGFIFHTMNAYENPASSTEITLHVSRIDAPFWEQTNQDLSKPSYLTQYVFDLENLAVSESRINDVPMDFGQVNRARTGQPYRYGYGLDFSAGSGPQELPLARGIIRHDHEAVGFERNSPGPEYQLGEALFVNDPDDPTEDGGWLLCLAFNESRNQTDLLVLDARDFSAAPMARVELPYRVPFGFHGVWVPDS